MAGWRCCSATALQYSLGASPDAERALRERLSGRTENPYEAVESEELDIRIDPARPEGLQEGTLVVPAASEAIRAGT